MDVLNDKHLPIEIITEILYRVPVEKIFTWVYTNKFINNFCNSIDFWRNYINNNQNKWANILLTASQQGEYSMFVYIWSISDKLNIIIEHKILDAAFKESVKSRRNKLSEWIYSKHIDWQEKMRVYEDEEDYADHILYMSSCGINNWEIQKAIILMTEAAVTSNIDNFRKICQSNNDFRYMSRSSTFYAPNIEIFKALQAIAYNAQAYSISLLDILRIALRYGNISLGTEIMGLIQEDIPEEYILNILESDNESAFDFLMSHNMYTAILQYTGPIRNWYTMKRYLKCDILQDNLKLVLLKSWRAFSFHQEEYVDIIYSRLQSLPDTVYSNLYEILVSNGEEYMAHLLKLKREKNDKQ